ncbi:DUF3018 family protein [Nocardioides panacis]|uniref:DUF3018 family protein n=1 Tax=Nocardioides panacis TaxID=2849501 RepID=A0A975SX71_9ACTN|nr:DUF3018 family protein [Nocardioides panacis]
MVNAASTNRKKLCAAGCRKVQPWGPDSRSLSSSSRTRTSAL